MQLFPHPDYVLFLSKTVIKNKIINNTNKRISLVNAEKKEIELLEAANPSYPSVSSNDVLCDQGKVYACRYHELLNQKVHCIKKVVQLAQKNQEYSILTSIPGIDPNSAVRPLAEIEDIIQLLKHDSTCEASTFDKEKSKLWWNIPNISATF